jgi:hypothetical protein
MRRYITKPDNEEAVSHLIEYLIISGVMVLLIIITMPVIAEVLIERPTAQLTSSEYIDIANGVSTRIVDIYAVPSDFSAVSIVSKFDIPDSVAGREYFVEIQGNGTSQNITVEGYYGQRSVVSLAGIGSTRKAGGRTTGHGVNQISYDYP